MNLVHFNQHSTLLDDAPQNAVNPCCALPHAGVMTFTMRSGEAGGEGRTWSRGARRGEQEEGEHMELQEQSEDYMSPINTSTA